MGLFNGFFENIDWETVDFHIHLKGSDAFGGTGDLEIHMAGEIFSIHEVAQNIRSVTVHNETHSDARDGALEWDTSVHESETR